MSFPGNVSNGQSNTTQKQAASQPVERQEIDPESRIHRQHNASLGKPKSLGAGTALAIGAFGTTLTTLSLSLMGWRDITMTNVYVAIFFVAGWQRLTSSPLLNGSLQFGMVSLIQFSVPLGSFMPVTPQFLYRRLESYKPMGEILRQRSWILHDFVDR